MAQGSQQTFGHQQKARYTSNVPNKKCHLWPQNIICSDLSFLWHCDTGDTVPINSDTSETWIMATFRRRRVQSLRNCERMLCHEVLTSSRCFQNFQNFQNFSKSKGVLGFALVLVRNSAPMPWPLLIGISGMTSRIRSQWVPNGFPGGCH